MLYNYHTHTNYCDGKVSARRMVEKAVELGISDLGFSSHVPLKIPNKWSMCKEELRAYCDEIRALKKEYGGKINIFLGLEYDYVYDKSYQFEELQKEYDLEYGIGSVHLVDTEEGIWFIDGPEDNYAKGIARLFGGNAKCAVQLYYKQLRNMIISQKFDIIGHLDKVKMNNKERYFSTNEAWYDDEVSETLELIREKRLIVEANTRGIYTGKYNGLYPGDKILKECCKMEIPVMVSTDAHKPDDLDKNYLETLILLKKIGYDSVMRFSGTEWYPVNINI